MNFDDDGTLADLGFLVIYAEDMYRAATAVDEKIVPIVDQRLIAEWEPVAFLTAHDAIIPPPGVVLPLNITSKAVYYGYLARRRDDPTAWVVAVRGTAGIAEWIIDGQFLWVPHPRAANTMVEHGFWDIYSTMNLIGLDGVVLDTDAARGIAKLIGTDEAVVLGHSLGSALATYLSYDLAKIVGGRVSACLFASPRTGDSAWAVVYHQTVGSYLIVNYVLDVVPHLPTRPGYATLQNERVLEPRSAQASVRLDVGCNHHLICYCAMLAYAKTMALPLQDVDIPLRGCVIGDQQTITNEALSMAAAVKLVGETTYHVSALFRGMFALNLDRRA